MAGKSERTDEEWDALTEVLHLIIEAGKRRQARRAAEAPKAA